MKLNETQAPFCRCKIITYADGNATATVKNQMLQLVSGFLYKGKNKSDRYGQVTCRIYIFYPEFGIGVDAGGPVHPIFQTDEEIKLQIPPVLLQGPAAVIEELDRVAANSGRITNAQIELARYIAPEKVGTYIESQHKRR